MLKQVTENKDVIKIASGKELNLNIIKGTYVKIIDTEKENEQIFRRIVMDLTPEFHKKINQREIQLGKDRNKFSVFEKQQLLDEFEKEHIDILQGARFDI